MNTRIVVPIAVMACVWWGVSAGHAQGKVANAGRKGAAKAVRAAGSASPAAAQDSSPGGMKSRRAQMINEYRAKRQAKSQEFRKTLQKMKREDRQKAVAVFEDGRRKEDKAFREELHTFYVKNLKEQLAANKTMTDADRILVSNYFETQYQESDNLVESMRSENAVFVEKTKNDRALNAKQKREAIVAFRSAQESKMKAFRLDQQNKRREFLKKIRPETAQQAAGEAGAPGA